MGSECDLLLSTGTAKSRNTDALSQTTISDQYSVLGLL